MSIAIEANELGSNERAASSSSSYGLNLKVTHLSLPFILSVPPTHQGYGKKENSWFLAHWFPFFFQLWKPRYLVVIGNYLIRYENEHSFHPKGKPIPLDVSEVRIDEDDRTELHIYNLWKEYSFRFTSEEECMEWARVLKKRKYEAIRENMKHVPVSEGVALVNKAADKKVQSFMKSIDASAQGEAAEVYNPLSYLHNPPPAGISS